jgi:hypothetical protein
VRINPQRAAPRRRPLRGQRAASAASGGFSVKINGEPVVEISAGDKDVRIAVPPGANSEEVRAASRKRARP